MHRSNLFSNLILVNKKQCPKCGEENPPEAVMCWACYTPLSGSGAVGGTTAAAGGGAAATHEEGEKKKIPPWQLGVIGVGLLLAVGIGVRSMMPASSSDGGDMGAIPPAEGIDPAGVPPGGGGGDGGPAPSPGSGNSGGSSITPKEAPFKIVVPPNPRLSTATMAIVTTDGNASGPQAASYAAYVRRQLIGSNRWAKIYIYVFSDEKSAQAFADFMKQRRGAELSGGDYASLSSLWGSALARYEYSGGKERVLYPSKNPSGWWYNST